MDSSSDMMEISANDSPNVHTFKPTSPVEGNLIINESSSQGESSEDDQASQEISPQALPSSTPVSPFQEKLSETALSSGPSTSTETVLPTASSEGESGPAPKKPRLDAMSMSSGTYLDSTVVPILHVALVTLDRIRPEDPVQFVADFLLKHRAQYSQKIPAAATTYEA